MTVFDLIVISLLFLEEFVKRSLIGIYKLYMKFDYCNFNSNLYERNKKLAEKTTILYNEIKEKS